MLKTKKQTQTVETEIITEKTCDCPNCTHNETVDPRKEIWNDWNDGEYETTAVQATIIDSGGRYKKYDFDVCPSCFVNLIVPLFNNKKKYEAGDSKINKLKAQILVELNNIKYNTDLLQEKIKSSNSIATNVKLLSDNEKLSGKRIAYEYILKMIERL